ncbi:MAG: hypothetical protein IKO10_13880, partial [Lachnospiraceae bacterium]|nr:hypothetical protein [Lachnospiraceae bacterium]
MTGRRLGKRIISGAMAFIMAASTLAVTPLKTYADGKIPTEMDSASLVNYDYVLGRAVDFGITAPTFVQQGHMETTFATNEFLYECGSNSDVDFLVGGTAQFLIGGVGTSKNNPDNNKVVFGSTTADVFNIEASPEVLGDSFSHNNGDAVDSGQEFGKIHFNTPVKSVVINKSDATQKNVTQILTNAKERSDEMSKRAASEYAVNYREYATINGNQITLDFTNSAFKNNVIYVQVDDKLAGALNESAGLKIKKDPSTVIVFNIEDNISNSTFKGTSSSTEYSDEKAVTIQKIGVSTDGSDNYIYTETSKSDIGYLKVDEVICQKIIWNVRTTGIVNLNICAGTFILPNCKDAVVTGSSAGWVVAPRVTVAAGEWHYIYQRGSVDTINDGNGEIHFAARKAFTTDYDKAGSESAEVKSIQSSANTYAFQMYSADSSYGSLSAIGSPVGNQETNKIHLPKITYTPDDNGKTFYYVIKEEGAGTKVVDHGATVEKSNGEIRMAVTVSYDEEFKSYTYTVTTKTILGNGRVLKENTSVKMSGVEFSLGAFYNKVEDVAAPEGTDVYISKKDVSGKELPGATLRLTGKNDDGSKVDMTAETITVVPGDEAGTPTRSEVDGLTFVSGTTPTLIKNLPNGEYTLTELTAPFGYEMAESITFEIKDGKVLDRDGKNYPDNKIIMVDAASVTNTGKIVLTKAIEGPVSDAEAKGALQFEITTIKEGKLLYVKPDGSTTKDETSFGLGEFTNINGKYILELDQLEAGEYSVTETVTDVPGYDFVSMHYTVDGVSGEINEKTAVVTVSTDSETTVAYTDVYKNLVPDTGKLVITKTIEGDVTKEEAEGALQFTITKEVGGITNYVKANGDLTTEETSIGLGQFTYNDNKWTLELNKLETGSYSVTETITDIDGYKLAGVSYTVDNNGAIDGRTASAQVAKDGTTTVAYTDKYEKEVVVPDTGKLVITKTIKGDVTKEEAEGALQFTITTEVNGNTNYVKADGSLTTEKTSIGLSQFSYANNKWTLELDKLETGSYNVTETITDIDGYQLAGVSYQVGDNSETDGKTASVTVNKDAETTVAYTDEYERKVVVPDTGKLVITKTIEGYVTKEEAEGALQFQITTMVDGQIHYVKADGSLTTEETTIGLNKFSYANDKWTLELDKLETGNYSVTETITSVKGYNLVSVSYTVGGSDESDGKTASASVNKDETTTIAYKDVYEKEFVMPETGKLVITKTIEGDVTKEEAEGALKFTITTDVNGVTNYVQANGKLTTEKTSIGLDAFDYDAANSKYTLELDKLDTGSYTVEETIKDIDGYELAAVTYKVNDSKANEGYTATVDVTKDKTTTVAYTDKYVDEAVPTATPTPTPAAEESGKLVITKTIEGEVSKEEAEGALQFTITTEVEGVTNYVKADGSLTTEKTSIGLSSFDNDNGKYTLTLDKLETGSYTVEETIKNIDGYKLAGVTYKVNDSKANEGETAVARVVKDETTTVAYTDKYEKEEVAPTYGTLVITKTIEGPVTEEEAKGALQFTITTEVEGTTNYVKADGSLTTEKTSIGLSAFDKDGDNYKLTLNKVETGEYSVTETITDIDGKVLISVSNQVTENGSTKNNESSSAKVTVSEDATTTVAYTDKYKEEDTTVETASIQLDKQDIYSSVEIAGATLKVTQNSAADQMSDFEGDGVKLERNGNTVASTRTSNSIEFVSGTAPAVLSGLTDGKYELEEVSAPEGYEVLTTSIKFTIENGDVTEINGPEGQYVLSGKTIIMKDDPVKVETTPAPTVEATPAPTEEVTPTPTAEATPAPTEEATPAPTAEATPAPTEEATPT